VGEESCIGTRSTRDLVAEDGETLDEMIDAIVTRYDHYVTDRKLDEFLAAWPDLTEAQRQALLSVMRCFRG